MNLNDTTIYRGGFTSPTLFVSGRKAKIEAVNGKIELTTWVPVSKGLSTVLTEIGPNDFPALLLIIAQASSQ